MAKGGHSHRSTLKTVHKSYKSKHASKGQLKNLNKGKVEKSTNGKATKPTTISKLARKNLARQLKANKIQELKASRKLFEGGHGVEKIVTVVSLTNDLASTDIAAKIVNGSKNGDQDDFVFHQPSVTNAQIEKFKCNLKIVIPDHTNLLSILDAVRVSDFVVFGLSAQEEISSGYGEKILRACIAQGIASVVGVLPNLVSAYPKRNLQLDIRQSLQSYFLHFFPSEEKLYALEHDTECSNCARFIAQKFPKSVNWRDSRGYLLADNVLWSQDEVNKEQGTLVVEGSVRGIGFNANGLVHIPGYGDFQIDHIEKLARRQKHIGMDVDETNNNAFYPDFNQDTLEELNPEEIEMEDDWKIEELDDDLGVRMDGKHYFSDSTNNDELQKKRKLPRGTSEYQGRWLLNDVLEEASDLESEEETLEPEDGLEYSGKEINEESMGDIEADNDDVEEEEEDRKSEMFVELSPEEEARQLEEVRSIAREDMEFPDEIELDPSESAKEVLGAYRGLKSLANCDWHYDEVDNETPSVWKRLLRVSNFKATRNKLMKDAIKTAQVSSGGKIRIFIKAPSLVAENSNFEAKPFVIYGLLTHEHKQAVLNFSFETAEHFEDPIPSKDTLIVQYGPRRQVIKPLFNQASNNANNVHKLERFAHPGSLSIATCVSPAFFTNTPTLFFKEVAGNLDLVGQGTLLNTDHTRVVTERVTLTGYPVKIHKKVVTVRYMFFNSEDINWFKAVPLFTKMGRAGFIKESLGTHGYFKATFDGRLNAQDTIGMSLYRRTWPELSSAYS